MEKTQNWAISSLKAESVSLKIALVVGGCFMLSLLAQIRFPLPFSPVPITGQTFAVALLALLYGRKLSFYTLAAYLGLGGLGLPVFQGLSSGLAFGPTLGYLIGMLGSASLIGYMADLGYARSFKSAFFSAYLGSLIVFACGSFVLSFFLPWNQVFLLGVLPFLPGDLIKNSLAASISQQVYK